MVLTPYSISILLRYTWLVQPFVAFVPGRPRPCYQRAAIGLAVLGKGQSASRPNAELLGNVWEGIRLWEPKVPETSSSAYGRTVARNLLLESEEVAGLLGRHGAQHAVPRLHLRPPNPASYEAGHHVAMSVGKALEVVVIA